MDIETITAAGVNYDDGLHRFGGKQALYEKFLVKFFQDESLLALQNCIAEGNYEDALKQAHTLKGIAGNLSLDVFYKAISAMVEHLKRNEIENLSSEMEELSSIYETLKKAITP